MSTVFKNTRIGSFDELEGEAREFAIEAVSKNEKLTRDEVREHCTDNRIDFDLDTGEAVKTYTFAFYPAKPGKQVVVSGYEASELSEALETLRENFKNALYNGQPAYINDEDGTLTYYSCVEAGIDDDDHETDECETCRFSGVEIIEPVLYSEFADWVA